MKSKQTLTLAMAALFAALCYIGFSYFRIDIPVGTEKTAFHLGNVFCVLAALFIGGFWGGMSGAVGMTIADLTTGYVTSAPKTFLLKLCIGLVAGFVAHKVFHISKEETRKIPLPIATVLSCAAGMAFNVVADPVVGYFYKTYLLGVPQEAAAIWAKMGAVTTLVNAVVAVVVDEVGNKAEEIKKTQEETVKKFNKPVLIFAVLGFVAAAAGLVMQIMAVMGMI